jgi:hypothetical protein
MKQIKLSLSGLILMCVIILSSCMPEVEAPVNNESVTNEPAGEVSGGENLRKGSEYNYSEEFANQLFQVDYSGNNPLGIAFFPGKGTGMANRMGKATSFMNQLAKVDTNTGGVITVNAPVTQFFANELGNLGLTGIPDEVSSLTTDGKGNAIWFTNIKNITTPISATLTEFEAEVEVVGGNGRFSKSHGKGVVKGTFNPMTGQGSSVLRARINY